MKNILTLLVSIVMISTQLFGVAASRISAVSLSFYNWSGSSYDVSSHKISIDGIFFDVSTLNIQSGTINVPAAGTLTFDGLTIPITMGSIGLWDAATNTQSPLASNLVSYVQWGAAGQSFESLAAAAFLWTVGNFISGNMPYIRTSFTTGDLSEWDVNTTSINSPALVLNNAINVSPNPVNDQLTISTHIPGNHQYQLFDITGKLLLDKRIYNTGQILVDTEILVSGTYIIRVTTMDGATIATRKIIKQ